MYVYLKKEKFLELIARKNLSQGAFAKEIGISETYLSMLLDSEKYDSSPSPELREKMLIFLGALFDELFFIQNYRYNGNTPK